MNFNKFKSLFLALLIALSLLFTGCSGLGSDADNGGAGNGDVSGEGDTGDSGNSDGTEGDQSGTNGSQGGENGDTNGGDSDGSGDTSGDNSDENGNTGGGLGENGFKIEDVPEFSGEAYVSVNNNTPYFKSDELSSVGFVKYTELDSLGRCGAATASIGRDTMPTDARESISHIYPSGWKYNGQNNNNAYPLLSGQTIYNRSHLLAHQLVSNDVDVRNIVTATPYLNQKTMVKFENMVADYVKETGNHVMYRVTPYFTGDELVARGILIEAYSVEDDGDGICFCVYLYNVQPGIEINYLTGENRLAGSGDDESEEKPNAAEGMPTEEKAYYLFAEGADGVYYLKSLSSNTFTTTKDKSEATKIYFEASGNAGEYYVYYLNGTSRMYINMTKDATKAYAVSSAKGSVTPWLINTSNKQIINATHTNRAMAFYSDKSDIRTYAISQTQIWVWMTEA